MCAGLQSSVRVCEEVCVQACKAVCVCVRRYACGCSLVVGAELDLRRVVQLDVSANRPENRRNCECVCVYSLHVSHRKKRDGTFGKYACLPHTHTISVPTLNTQNNGHVHYL